jgi:hypothetical protein
MPKQSRGQRTWYERNKKDQIAKSKKAREEFNAFLAEVKHNHGCSLCPETNPVCLQFHHKDKKVKKFTVAEGIRRGFSKTRILEEITKCDIIRSNCHFKLHAEEVLMVTRLPSKQE